MLSSGVINGLYLNPSYKKLGKGQRKYSTLYYLEYSIILEIKCDMYLLDPPLDLYPSKVI